MEEKNSKCFSCFYFERYYTKEVKHFQKLNFGNCILKRENVSAHGSCDGYRLNSTRKNSKRVLKMYLNDIFTEISEVRKLLEEENGEFKDDEKM